jgi:hypothetical protein
MMGLSCSRLGEDKKCAQNIVEKLLGKQLLKVYMFVNYDYLP